MTARVIAAQFASEFRVSVVVFWGAEGYCYFAWTDPNSPDLLDLLAFANEGGKL